MDVVTEFKRKISLFIKKKIEYPELKATSSCLAIYKQKDGKFMSRIRLPGGELSIEKLKTINAIAQECGADFIHLTTRADIQLHGVNPLNLGDLLSKYQKNSLACVAGGGNCIRAATVSSHSGVHPSSSFDVVPYAQAMEKAFGKFEKTISLPRKIKTGFSCCPDDCDNARYQDLGFVAKLSGSKKCFDVFVGGALGKSPAVGVKVLESVPAEECLNVVYALMNMFYDHGNRQDRNKARIKFIVDAKGEEEFKKLFISYYSSEDKVQSAVVPDKSDFASQFNNTVSPSLITVYIPYGILSHDDLDALIKVFETFKVRFIRLTRERNITCLLSNDIVYDFYTSLKELKKNYTGESFKGLITTCIGAKTCDIGLTDPTKFADIASAALDKYFAEKPEYKRKLFKEILKSLKISGCPNSCGYNKIARLGLSGVKSKNEQGESIEMCRFSTTNTEFTYSEALKNKPLAAEELSGLVGELVSNLLKKKGIQL
ncbi:MAG: nitrite/sulfite reductase [Lentisphaerota bacterium]